MPITCPNGHPFPDTVLVLCSEYGDCEGTVRCAPAAPTDERAIAATTEVIYPCEFPDTRAELAELERLRAENARLRDALGQIVSYDNLATQTRAGCRRVARGALNGR